VEQAEHLAIAAQKQAYAQTEQYGLGAAYAVLALVQCASKSKGAKRSLDLASQSVLDHAGGNVPPRTWDDGLYCVIGAIRESTGAADSAADKWARILERAHHRSPWTLRL
jgi:hypothetical protein